MRLSDVLSQQGTVHSDWVGGGGVEGVHQEVQHQQENVGRSAPQARHSGADGDNRTEFDSSLGGIGQSYGKEAQLKAITIRVDLN